MNNFLVLRQKHVAWISALISDFPDAVTSGEVSAATLISLRENYPNINHPSVFQTDKSLKVARGVFSIPDIEQIRNFSKSPEDAVFSGVSTPQTTMSNLNMANTRVNSGRRSSVTSSQADHIPQAMTGFVPSASYRQLVKIFKSEKFYPVYLSGPTGIGKTTDVNQAAVSAGRGVIRTNITWESDESDLIGSYSLKDGNTVFEYGPVVEAMRTGSVLLLDEIDLGSSRIMCLQPVLEGNSIFIKKTSEWIHPAPGFTVVATANTKGRGSDSGHFVGTQFMNEAMLDRFSLWIDMSFPTPTEELNILVNYMESLSLKNPIPDDTIKSLIQWAGEIRKTYNMGGVEDTLSTRRLKDIITHMAIFNSTVQVATSQTIQRFSEDVRSSFMRFYSIIFAEIADDDTITENSESVEDSSGANQS